MASAIFSESATESLIACPSSRSKAFKLSSSRKVVLLALIRFYGGSRKDTSTSAPTCHCTFGQPYVLEWGHERKWIFAFQSQLGFSALARRLGYVSRLLEARPPAFPRSRRDALCALRFIRRRGRVEAKPPARWPMDRRIRSGLRRHDDLVFFFVFSQCAPRALNCPDK